MNKKLLPKKLLLISLILLIGSLFRFINLNWDDNHHLHPDERFLTMVSNEMSIPSSFAEYLDPAISTFNPRNLGHSFYVYGSFPLISSKITAILFNSDTYNDFTIHGRTISAFLDLILVFVVFKVAEILEKNTKKSSHKQLPKNTKYWASFLYAVAVLPIQLSHFFTVDTFANLFIFSSVYFSIRFYYSDYSEKITKKSKLKRNLWKNNKMFFNIVFSSILFGLALASKVSAILALPLILFFVVFGYYNGIDNKGKIFKILISIVIFFLSSYLTLRLADPNLFASSNITSPQIHPGFIANFHQLKSWEGKDVWFPPAVQWINKTPIIFSGKNIAIFGLGLPYFFLLIYGYIIILKNNLPKPNIKSIIKRIKEHSPILVISLWTILFFLYQSTQFVKSLRYFFYLYPYFAIIAGIGASCIFSFIIKKLRSALWVNKINFNKKRKLQLVSGLLITILLIWPLMFISIYIRPHSRVTASRWIYNNLEDNSVIGTEIWDDPLPLYIETDIIKNFDGIGMNVFDLDEKNKWVLMNNQLNKIDYYILSSNRGWGSMPTVPDKYPLMSQYYSDLFNEKTDFTKVAEFTSYPSLEYLGIPITLSDDWAEEAFTVYDHPRVMIYKNRK